MTGQKPKVKKAGQGLKEQAEQWAARAVRSIFGLTRNWRKTGDMAQNNYELGLRHLQLGNLSDAIFRFKIVTWSEPTNAQGWFRLGEAYVMDGQLSAGKKALMKALQLKPEFEEAAYMLAIANGKNTPANQLPRRMPLLLAYEHFEGQAANFNSNQVDTYGYQGHKLLTNAIREALTPGRIDHLILELGVGTGLAGAQLRDVAANLTGVDLSQAMLNEALKLQNANGAKTYDALIHKEIQAYLREAQPQSWDIVLAAGVVSYIGDLQLLFEQVARVLRNGGIFAMTADPMEGTDFRFDPQAGRFRYSRAYLEGLAQHVGLRALRLEEAEAYPNYKVWLCVFVK